MASPLPEASLEAALLVSPSAASHHGISVLVVLDFFNVFRRNVEGSISIGSLGVSTIPCLAMGGHTALPLEGISR